MTGTDIKALVARGKSTFEGVPRDRLAWDLADALERQQAVVEAAQRYTKYYDEAGANPDIEGRWAMAAEAVVLIRRKNSI